MKIKKPFLTLINLFFLILLCTGIIYAAPPPSMVQNLTATQTGNDISLQWPPTTTDLYGTTTTIDHYNVYRDIDPQFIPDYASGSNRIDQPTGISYVDMDALSATESYYYAVTAVTTDETESMLPSNTACKIRHDLVYDDATGNRHWLALPFATSLATAGDLGASAPNISSVIRWNPISQTKEIWDVATGTGINFPITAGEAYSIIISADTTINLVGSYLQQDVTLVHNDDNFSLNWLAVPQPNDNGVASELAAEIPNATKFAYFDNAQNTYHSWFKLGANWMGDDFSLTPGLGVAVAVSNAALWTPQTGVPQTTIAANPLIGYESITVDLSAVTSQGLELVNSYQWDFEGDGVFDQSSAAYTPLQHTYTAPGTYHPTLLVTDDAGRRALGYQTVAVESLQVNFSAPGFTPSAGESMDISYILPVDGLVTIEVYNQDGTLIKTLVVDASQAAGAQSVSWDGLDNLGQPVGDGSYFALISFTVDGHTSVYDTRATSGSVDISSQLTGVAISSTLSPLEGQYVTIDFILPENALVMMNITDPTGTIIRHLLNNVPMVAGSHQIIWDGADDLGTIVPQCTGFSVAIAAISLASNSFILQGQALTITDVSAAPLRFSPAINPYGVIANGNVTINYTVNRSADVTATVYDASGTVVQTITTASVSAGAHQIAWGGSKISGVLAADGIYTIQLKATDSGGVSSDIFTLNCEIFY